MKIYESFHRVFLARKYRLKRMNPRSFWIQNIEKKCYFGVKKYIKTYSQAQKMTPIPRKAEEEAEDNEHIHEYI